MKNNDQNYLSSLNGARIHEVSSMSIGCSADNVLNPDKQVYIINSVDMVIRERFTSIYNI